jgi:hypothetical protein
MNNKSVSLARLWGDSSSPLKRSRLSRLKIGKAIQGLRDHSRIVLREGIGVALKRLHSLPTAP